MTPLETGKFIEEKGLEIVVALAAGVILLAGWVFYAYSWKAVDSASEMGFKEVTLKEGYLNDIMADLDKRSANLERLKQNRFSPRDIFR